MNSVRLEIQDIRKSFSGVTALAGFTCSVRHGEILGLIGPNGAGKTTLFNVLSGFIKPDRGKALFCGADVINLSPHSIAEAGIARTFQNLRLIRQISVIDNVLLAFKNQPGERLVNIFFRPRRTSGVEAKNRKKAVSMLESVGLGSKLDAPADNLSYGQQKLLSIVCCLAADAELLLLDEPVAGIAPEMIERILSVICGLPALGKSVVIIEHNMDVITQVCSRVIFMDEGTMVSEGTPEQVRGDPKVIEAYLH